MSADAPGEVGQEMHSVTKAIESWRSHDDRGEVRVGYSGVGDTGYLPARCASSTRRRNAPRWGDYFISGPLQVINCHPITISKICV